MRILLTCLLPLMLLGSTFNVGDGVAARHVTDQHGKRHLLNAHGVWVVTWDRQTTATANRYFEQHPRMLGDGNIALVVDVSQTPEGILSLFVMPRMRSYTHPILLSYDEAFNRKLPYQEGMLTVLHLHEGRIEKVEFAEDEGALAALLQ